MITVEERIVRNKINNNKKSFILFTTISIITNCYILLIIPVINVIRMNKLWTNFIEDKYNDC